MADKIRSFLHFSRPDEGPLREYETWMPDFMDGMAKGIYSNIPKIERAIRAVSGTMDLSVSKEFKTQGMDYDKMYQVVRAGSSGEMVMMLNHRVVGRVLKEMGVVFA